MVLHVLLEVLVLGPDPPVIEKAPFVTFDVPTLGRLAKIRRVLFFHTPPPLCASYELR